MKKQKLLRCVAFLLLLALVCAQVQGMFGVDSERAYVNLNGLGEETPGSLDAVYIGSSNVYTFWQPALGWADRGIAVWSMSVDSLPVRAVLYLIKEARKTQPDALFIVNLNTFRKKTTNLGMTNNHRVLDYFPFSMDKIQMIGELSKAEKRSLWGQLEYFFPIIRFHDRWDSLASWSFGILENPYKTSLTAERFMSVSVNITANFQTTELTKDLSEDMGQALNQLLDYCDEEQVNILFVRIPQTLTEDELATTNTEINLVRERGYPCLDALEAPEDYSIDLSADYFDLRHMNIHGSIKYCEYLGAYLTEHYGFTDKRGQPGWESWDAAAAAYEACINTWTLPFERAHALRDYTLTTPALHNAAAQQQTIQFEWDASEGAQRYEVYRKDGDSAWALAGETEALSWTDTALEPECVYTYTVVPCRETEQGRVYGQFSFKGTKAKTEAMS